jgi:hypothetical protein
VRVKFIVISARFHRLYTLLSLVRLYFHVFLFEILCIWMLEKE